MSNERATGLDVAIDGQGAQARRRRPQQFEESGRTVGEAQRAHQEPSLRLAVAAEQAQRSGHGGLRLRPGGPLQAFHQTDRRGVADLPQREHRILPQRSVEFGNLRNGSHGAGGLVVAECLDRRSADVLGGRA